MSNLTRPSLPVMSSWFYKIAGFSIESVVDLPHLERCVISAVDKADVQIHLGVPAQDWQKANPEPFMNGSMDISPQGLWLDVPFIGQMWVLNGNAVYWDRGQDGDVLGFRSLLVNTLLAVIAHQRELLPLHISAVEVNGQAVAFQGESGSGKSTLAIMLMQRGYPVITEDLGVLEFEHDCTLCRPGLPYYRLWKRTLDHLGEDRAQLPAAWMRSQKHYREVEAERFAIAPLPLTRIYFIEEPEDATRIAIEPIKGFEAAMALMNSVIFGQFGALPGQQARYFRDCTRVSQECQCFRLIRPKDFDRAEEVLDVLQAHLCDIQQTPSNCH